MHQFLEACFAWPIVPATILLMAVCTYWLFVILGALHLDFGDLHLDMDADVHADVDMDGHVDVPGHGGGILGIGLVSLRFLNLGSVPLMMWMSVFALAWWFLAMWLEGPTPEPSWSFLAVMLARDIGLAAVATKILTQPLRGRFDIKEPHPAHELIGKTCVITTSTANEKFGRGRFETEAAPLYLNVRAQEGEILKGDSALIVDFDPEQRIYFVKSTIRETV
jgi:hypothetical protein